SQPELTNFTSGGQFVNGQPTDLTWVAITDLDVESEPISFTEREYQEVYSLLHYLFSHDFAESGDMSEFEAELSRTSGRTWDAMAYPQHGTIVEADSIIAVVGGSLCILAVVRREWQFGIALVLLLLWRHLQ